MIGPATDFFFGSGNTGAGSSTAGGGGTEEVGGGRRPAGVAGPRTVQTDQRFDLGEFDSRYTQALGDSPERVPGR